MKYAVSACLLGVNCKYNGGNNEHKELLSFLEGKEVVPICPECAGGLPIPRISSEIRNGRVRNKEEEDVSEAFYKGAEKEIKKLLDEKADLVITQPRSPSCGKGKIYDGTFSKTLIDGDGIFVQMCKNNGLCIKNVDEFLIEVKNEANICEKNKF